MERKNWACVFIASGPSFFFYLIYIHFNICVRENDNKKGRVFSLDTLLFSLKSITTYLAYSFFPWCYKCKEILKTMGIMLLLLLYISFLRLFLFYCFLVYILFAYIVGSCHSLPEIHISIVDNDALPKMCVFPIVVRWVGE